MPHLVSWTRQYASYGLYVIASHVQRATKEKIERFCRLNRLNFTVVTSAQVEGDTSRFIPHMWIFDHTGKCVWEGHPGTAAKPLKDIMEKCPHPLLAGLKLNKLSAINTALKKGYPPGKILRQLRSKARSRDPEVAAEAKQIAARLNAHGEKLLKKAEECRSGDPYQCYVLYEKLKKDFSGSDIAKEAEKKLRELKKDKAFMKEYQAGKIFAAIRLYADQLKPLPGGSIDLSDPDCSKLNRKVVRRIVSAALLLKKRYSDTTYYEKAKGCLNRLGLKY